MLLKIGKKYLPLEQVTEFADDKDWNDKPQIRAYFNYTIDGMPNYTAFSGDERLALLSYLDSMAVDVLAVYAEKNKPDCATCGDTGVIGIRNGDDAIECPDCTDYSEKDMPH